MVNGKLIAVKVDGARVDCELDCVLSIDNELMPRNSKTSGAWRKNLEGYKSFAVVVNAIVTKGQGAGSLKGLLARARALNSVVTLDWASFDGDMIYRGDARIRTLEISSPSDGFATINANFVGDGDLKEIAVWT